MQKKVRSPVWSAAGDMTRGIPGGMPLVNHDLTRGVYFAGAAGVASGAGAGAGADVSAGLGSLGAMAFSGQPMIDKDNNIKETAIITEILFFTFPSSFFKLTFTYKTLEISFSIC